MTALSTSPYRPLPASSFWKTSVAETNLAEFDPIVTVPFKIATSDRVATAGSCFAQHISKALMREGVQFLQTEQADPADARHLPIYSARYGNIYTCRQLLQLFQRAYGLFTPRDTAWRREDGRFVDPFRSKEFPAAFATVEGVETESRRHLAKVREMFETCNVFVFTLGLTEAWLSDDDGAAVPLPPGVVATPISSETTYSPVNLPVQDMTEDLLTFIDDLRLVNPGVRFLITVSPVPIIATFEQRHVIVSNTYSKAALRVVADMASNERPDVLYFPSYEMIAAHPKARYFDSNFRTIEAAGVDAVMTVFRRRILTNDAAEDTVPKLELALDALASPGRRPEPAALESEFKSVICDEEMIAR